MKHLLLRRDINYQMLGTIEIPSNYYYNRKLGAWVTKDISFPLVKSRSFVWAATKKKDISLGEDMK